MADALPPKFRPSKVIIQHSPHFFFLFLGFTFDGKLAADRDVLATNGGALRCFYIQ